MSDNIPFEIHEDIVKMLTVRSLIQFQSVSKAWKSLIDSSRFIAQYSTQQQHLLVRGRIIGCTHGLLCVYGHCHNSDTVMAVVWNPSIRKSVGVVVPKDGIYITALGFGVCRETNDPKIVMPNKVKRGTNIPCQVEVFILSNGAWRSPYSTNLPRNTFLFDVPQMVIDGFLYWLASEKIASCRYDNLIISFDITSEEFSEVNLPDCLEQHPSYQFLSMSKLRESLVVLRHDIIERDVDVWMMEDGVPKSFIKLFSVNVNRFYGSAMGLRKSGAPIVENCTLLVVYEPYSEHRDNIRIQGKSCTVSMYPYVETLLLQDQTDLRVYNDI
ncbi:hypothetical protein L1987_65275 [Smallanthus sonchifolius]|uniref:Uncharacterized protein n=1 Tax=Smallanthus sonchifolius TaxID=185202 RepID=A0ACB9BU25_9ASTR|nr:hypothetical protein L1987_65275 [Smallanthus sonchifolius]